MSKSRDFLGPYRLARLIRIGSTAEVWEAFDDKDPEKKRYALKVLRASCSDDKAEVAALKHECNVGKALNSPRIIKVVDFQTDKGRPFLVLELFSELNMKQALRKGPDSLAFMLDKIIEQAAEGLYYMHTKNWIHRDIKPDNYLVARDGETKLIDFTIAEPKRTGLSKMLYRAKNIRARGVTWPRNRSAGNFVTNVPTCTRLVVVCSSLPPVSLRSLAKPRTICSPSIFPDPFLAPSPTTKT